MNKHKKHFVKSDLGGVTEASGPSTEGDSAEFELLGANNSRVYFKRGNKKKSFDFGPWYGGNIDQITAVCHAQVVRFVRGMDREYSMRTISTMTSALRWFLEYCLLRAAALQRELTLSNIDRALVDGFVDFLDGKYDEVVSRKKVYGATRMILKTLCDRGVITETYGGDNATFPINPFPGAHQNGRGYKPFSTSERKALSAAVKEAVMPLFTDGVEPTSNLLAYALFLVALHTGRNTTPLLEMGADCLRPHPKTGVMFLVLFKRRSHSESKVALRDQVSDDDLDSLATLRPTVVGLIRRLIELSEHLRAEASEDIRDSLWLYRTKSAAHGLTPGRVLALDDGALSRSAKLLVKRYQLVDAEGKPLQVNVSRLRKTFINRVFEILGGDIVATAAAAGNSVQVAGINYLRPGADAEKNWLFMGLTLTNELLTGTVGATERTPVARCSDNRKGDFAPKRSELICTSFLNCLRCRNLVVTGEDLYRLFSFYWRVLKERASMDPRRWKRQMAHIVRLIDRDVIEAGIAKGTFRRAHVDRERERAFANPHPYWRSDVALSELGALGSI